MTRCRLDGQAKQGTVDLGPTLVRLEPGHADESKDVALRLSRDERAVPIRQAIVVELEALANRSRAKMLDLYRQLKIDRPFWRTRALSPVWPTSREA